MANEFWKAYHTHGIIPNIWKGITGQLSNELTNEENLDYQRERNEIEDARYADETEYNRAFAEEERDYQRAFAENERDYQRALQNRIFAREDTAIQRQAEQLSALGINPLSQQMSGLDSGQALSASAPGASPSAPSASSRGGTALNKQLTGVNATSALLGIADTMNGIQTGEYQRDALALQNDKQFLENLKEANGLGIEYSGYMPRNFKGNKHYTKTGVYFEDKTTKKPLFDTPLYESSLNSTYRKMNRDSMPNWQYTLESLGNDDVYNQAEQALTKAANLFDKVSDNMFEGKGKNFNPFNWLLSNLFN